MARFWNKKEDLDAEVLLGDTSCPMKPFVKRGAAEAVIVEGRIDKVKFCVHSVKQVKQLTAGSIILIIVGVVPLNLSAAELNLRVKSQKGWNQNDDRESISLGTKEDEGFCFLTMVSGKFEGTGEEVRIFAEDGFWRLGGRSRQEDVAAGARCVEWESEHALTVIRKEYIWEQGERPTTVGMEEGQGFCFLTRLSGDFEGAGERVEIQRDGGRWQLRGRSLQNDFSERLVAGMRCVRWPLTLRSTWEEYYWSQRRPEPVSLPMKEGEGFCYLSMVQGKLHGGGETVFLHINDGRWRLDGESGQEGVAAAARCVEFD